VLTAEGLTEQLGAIESRYGTGVRPFCLCPVELLGLDGQGLLHDGGGGRCRRWRRLLCLSLREGLFGLGLVIEEGVEDLPTPGLLGPGGTGDRGDASALEDGGDPGGEVVQRFRFRPRELVPQGLDESFSLPGHRRVTNF
jgi:hypothetical protein